MPLFNAEQRIVFILTGLGDNGKSLYMADTIYENLCLYKYWWENGITKIPRYIALNPKTMKMAKHVEEDFGIWPNGYIRYYNGLKELSELSQCDVVLDELSTNFNSRRWADMSQEIIDWFNTLGHNGIFIYGTAQNFLDVDITIRRKTQNVIALSKLCGSRRPAPSMPPVKRIWGVIIKTDIHYTEIDKDETKRKLDKRSIRPFLITKFRCGLYDTLQKIETAEFPPYHHVNRGCDDPEHKDVYGKPFQKAIHI